MTSPVCYSKCSSCHSEEAHRADEESVCSVSKLVSESRRGAVEELPSPSHSERSEESGLILLNANFPQCVASYSGAAYAKGATPAAAPEESFCPNNKPGYHSERQRTDEQNESRSHRRWIMPSEEEENKRSAVKNLYVRSPSGSRAVSELCRRTVEEPPRSLSRGRKEIHKTPVLSGASF